MDHDETKGAGNELKGNIKKGLGNLTGNEKLQAEGEADKVEGKTQRKVGAAKEEVRGAGHEVKGSLKEMGGKLTGDTETQMEGQMEREGGNLKRESAHKRGNL